MRTGLAVKNPFFYAILCFLPLEVIVHSDFGLQIWDFPFYPTREKDFLLLGETEPVSPSHVETVILFFKSGKNHSCFSSRGETRMAYFSSSKPPLQGFSDRD